MHYFIICFLEYHSEQITTAEYSQIPSIISQLTIKNIEMIDIIFENARRLRAETPYSFRMFFSYLDIFKPFSTRHKELFEYYQPETLICLPMLSSEIFFIAYNKIVSCPDKSCKFFNNLYDYENGLIASEKQFNENHCQDNNSNNFFNEEESNIKNFSESNNNNNTNSNNNYFDHISEGNININVQIEKYQQEYKLNANLKNSQERILGSHNESEK